LECAVNVGTADRCVGDKNAPPTGNDPALDDAPAARLAACAVNVSRTASVPRISRANIPRDAFLTRVATRGTRRQLAVGHSPLFGSTVQSASTRSTESTERDSGRVRSQSEDNDRTV
jgi:hypothetical protein